MKGVVFTEFLSMVENQFSAAMVDEIIERAAPPSGGAYTAVGTYDHTELGSLVAVLAKQTGAQVPELLKAYGRYLFVRFAEGYGAFFEGAKDSFEFLRKVETVIHVEVRKLYPDAELPKFTFSEPEPGKLLMVYRSPRCLGDFAQGLIEGCIAHFDDKIDIQRESDMGHTINFLLTRAG